VRPSVDLVGRCWPACSRSWAPQSFRPASPTPPRAASVVVSACPGCRWSRRPRLGLPALWRLAGHGSVVNLVDYVNGGEAAELPADGWLTLTGWGPGPVRAQPNSAMRTRPRGPARRRGGHLPRPARPRDLQPPVHNTPYGRLSHQTQAVPHRRRPGAALAWPTVPGRVAPTCPARPGHPAVLARCR